MSKKLFIVLLIVVTIINLSATATILYERWSKKDSPRRMMMPDDEPGQFLHDRFDLRPEQVDSIKASMREFWENVQGPMADYSDLRDRLFEEIKKDSANSDSIHKIIDLMGEMQTRIRHESVEQLLRDKSYFSPQQHQHIIRMFMGRMEGEFSRPMFDKMRKFKHGRGKNRKHFQADSLRKFRNRNQTKSNNGGSL
jgi:hypothetical protein